MEGSLNWLETEGWVLDGLVRICAALGDSKGMEEYQALRHTSEQLHYRLEVDGGWGLEETLTSLPLANIKDVYAGGVDSMSVLSQGSHR
jgi:hypothetical protein